jgi:hypothetical protein
VGSGLAVSVGVGVGESVGDAVGEGVGVRVGSGVGEANAGIAGNTTWTTKYASARKTAMPSASMAAMYTLATALFLKTGSPAFSDTGWRLGLVKVKV